MYFITLTPTDSQPSKRYMTSKTPYPPVPNIHVMCSRGNIPLFHISLYIWVLRKCAHNLDPVSFPTIYFYCRSSRTNQQVLC